MAMPERVTNHDGLVGAWLADSVPENRRRAFQLHANAFLKDLDTRMRGWRVPVASYHLAHYESLGVSLKMVAIRREVIRSFMKFVARQAGVMASPAKAANQVLPLPMPAPVTAPVAKPSDDMIPEIETLTQPLMSKILAVTARTSDRLVLALIYRFGLKSNDIERFRSGDFSRNGKSYILRVVRNTERFTIELPANLAPSINFLRVGLQPSELFFKTQYNQPYTSNYIAFMVAEAGRRIGFSNLTPKQIRDSGASHRDGQSDEVDSSQDNTARRAKSGRSPESHGTHAAA